MLITPGLGYGLAESGTSPGGRGEVKATTQGERPRVDARGTVLVPLFPGSRSHLAKVRGRGSSRTWVWGEGEPGRLCEGEVCGGRVGHTPQDAPASISTPSLEGDGDSGVDWTGARETRKAKLVPPPYLLRS